MLKIDIKFEKQLKYVICIAEYQKDIDICYSL